MPRRLEAKPLWIGGVFVLYTVCLWFRVSNMPFLKDDSQWIGITQQIVSGAIPWNQIFQSGVFSTGLVPHSYLTAFVFSLVYLVSPSVYSVALLCAASVLGTHAVLVQIGKEFGDWRTGLMASLLLFFCPLNYLYYSLRTWNLVFLPLGIVVFLLFVFRFHRKGQTRDLLLASAMLGVATNFHPTALVLLPLLWSTLAQRDLPFRVVVLAALSIT